MKQTLFLIDGNALLHRAWHAIPPLSTKDGLVVNAVYGFTNVIEKIRETYKPDYMVIAWDLPGKTFRHEAFVAYKAQREKKEQALYDQIPMIQELMRAYHIPSIDAPGYEADDVIGTLAEQNKKQMKVVIVTGDADALQLVDDQVSVLSFVKGVSETKLYDEEAVKVRFGLSPLALIEYKAIRGDTSDNIPGVVGIGEKGALDLIQTHHSVEHILRALKQETLEEKYAKKIRGQEEVLAQARMLVEIVRDVPFVFDVKEAKQGEINLLDLKTLLEKYEFRTLLRKYAFVEEKPQENKEVKTKTATHFAKTLDELRAQMSSASNMTMGVFVGNQQADLFGSTVAVLIVSNGKTSFVFANPTTSLLKEMESFLSQAELVIVADQKALMHVTSWSCAFPVFDLSVASYVLNAGTRSVELPDVIQTMLGGKVIELPTTFGSEKDQKKIADIVSLFPLLYQKMTTKMKKDQVESVFRDIEMPLIPVLVDMEKNGIEIDIKSLSHLSKKIGEQISASEKSILKLAGVEFNVNSPPQLADVLFETLHLSTKHIKKTKTGYSTAASELEKLWEEHEIIPFISDYRELSKLQSTYVEALPKLMAKDGRIHTTFHQTVTATGRLSSSDPNLQNIPIRTELGREIRKAFVASKHHVLVSADYSQIELRLMAILAKDKALIQAFHDGADIHTRTASEVWDIKESEVTKDQRRAAKAINFGILYGMGPRSLARSTGFSTEEAKHFIDRYFEVHTSVRDYLDCIKEQAHEDGYVETHFGRRRYVPEIHSGVHMLVAQAERMAINMPLQGTAADLMKMAMLAVHGWIKQSRLQAKLLLQVHDELVLEVKKEDVELAKKGLKEMMEGVAQFDVPLSVEVKVGGNWGEMEDEK